MTSGANPLAYLARHSSWLLAAGIFLGLLWPALARWAAPLFSASVVGLLAATLMRQDMLLLRRAAARWRLLFFAVFWQLVGLALIIYGVLSVLDAFSLGLDNIGGATELPMILILSAGCPPILSAIAFALLFRLDAAFATLLVLISVFLAPLTLPLIALAFVEAPLGINTGQFMVHLAVLVGSATGIALLAHGVAGKTRIDRYADEIDGVAVLLLLLFGVAIMDGVTEKLLSQPWLALTMLLAGFGLNGSQHVISLAVFRPVSLPTRGVIGISAGNRNLGLLFAALGTAASPELALFVALAQFPIYFTPLMLKPFYRPSSEDPSTASS